MKKLLKIAGIAIGVLLILLLLLPFAFRGKITERIRHEINQQVYADVDFGRVRLSLIRQFPDVSLQVNELLVVGRGAFSGDTLADINSLRVSFDLFSLFRTDEYAIKSIRLYEPRLLLKTLEDGSYNWDLSFPDEDVPAEPDEEDSASPFRVELQEVRIRSGHFVYFDDYYLTYITAEDINATLSGDLSMDITNIHTKGASIGSFSLRYDNWPVLTRVKALLDVSMTADLNDFIFTFNENQLLVNELPLVFDGMVGFPEGVLTMDFSFGAARARFADFLSLVPAVYTKDFETLTTDGNLQLDGFVNGIFSEDIVPGFGLNIIVDNAMFQYPGLPASVQQINLQASLANPGGDADLTTIDIPRFGMNMGGNPVNLRFNMRNPISDPRIDAWLSAQIDLGSVGNFYPLEEGIQLKGKIHSNLEARGRLSDLEAGRYEAFHAAGELQISELLLDTEIVPHQLQISEAGFRLTPRAMHMDRLDMQYGQTDISANGQIDNIIGYLFDKQVLAGAFSTSSNRIDLNQLMASIPETEEQEEQQPLSVIRVPKNIDFTLLSSARQVLFGKLALQNVTGELHLANEQLNMEKLQMEVLGGTLALQGSYNTAEELPEIHFGLDISGFDIKESFLAFNTFRILAPIAEYANGRFSAALQLNGLLSETLTPVLSTLTGNGRLSTSSAVVSNTPVMLNLADQLKMDMFREIRLQNLRLNFSFADGKVDVAPFELPIGQSVAHISGSNFFDQRINYLMKLEVPYQQFGPQANQLLSNMFSELTGRGLNLDPGDKVLLNVVIGGTFTSPDVSLNLSSNMESIGSQLRGEAERLLREAETRARDEAEERVRTTIDESETRVRAELEERANAVMEQANRQAETIRREAANAAERMRNEARQQSQRLQNEAQGPIAKAAAKLTGEALVREADQKAEQLLSEADKNASRIIEEAQQQADRIRTE
jgi:uncharacterized protein involved in outer membrane biogenesis